MKVAIAFVMVLAATTSARADGTALDGVELSDFNVDGVSAGNRASEFAAGMSDASSQLGQLAGGVSSGLNAIQQVGDMFGALSDLDQELSNRLQDDHSGPQVPSSCGSAAGGSGAPSCAECYTAAYNEVNFTRQTLERLRTIHSRTIAYITAAEAVGDTTSGIHAVTGLSWQYAKADVEKTKREFNTTSKAKYEALIQNMRRALDMVAACERDHFHNPDWYNRFGFIYFDFVKDAYAIHD